MKTITKSTFVLLCYRPKDFQAKGSNIKLKILKPNERGLNPLQMAQYNKSLNIKYV